MRPLFDAVRDAIAECGPVPALASRSVRGGCARAPANGPWWLTMARYSGTPFAVQSRSRPPWPES